MEKKIKNILLCLIFFTLFFPFGGEALTVEVPAVVAGCGDGIIGSGEQCDGSNKGGSSCSTLGFTGGTLSCSSACTFITSSCFNTLPSSGGGGLFSLPSIPDTNVVFSGRAYPLSRVGILKDGQLVLTTIAGPDSNFTATISGLSSGNYVFSVYGEDRNNERSSLFTFPIYITAGLTTKIGGIFIAPTIMVDKEEVKKGDTISIFGQSIPNSEVSITVNSLNEFIIKKITDKDGIYLINFDSGVLEIGDHSTKSKVAQGDEISNVSKTIPFRVGNKNILVSKNKLPPSRGDSNSDGKVNLIDFSIAAFWYKKSNPPSTVDMNKDGIVDLIDFSIMAFYWTG